MMIQTINPSTGHVLQEYPCLNDADTTAGISAGQVAFQAWRQTTFAQRRRLMLELAQRLQDKVADFALLIAREMGKPIAQGRQEIEKCALVCRHYAEQAETYLEGRFIQTEMTKTQVCYEPLGLIFAIMPWNFPFWQVFRFLVPTIMAGNTVLLKHAPICSGSGQAIAALLLDAGFPAHVFQHMVLSNDGAARVLAHPAVRGLSFTGSDKTGRIVSAQASAHLKKSVLELGGSDPCLVLDDADLDLAAQVIVKARLRNSGQVCVAPKRIIADVSIYKQLVDKIMNLLPDYPMGDPEHPDTKLGPMAREDLRLILQNQVDRSVAQGARLRTGGQIPAGAGFYYPPTVLVDVKPGMPAFDEELFGPVISVIAAQDEADALALANNSIYGLAAAVFTRDSQRGERLAHRINTGSCFVNAEVASDPRVPFGGILQSGFGRELSREGILEFVNTKTICIK